MIGTAFLVDLQGSDHGDHALLNFRGQQCVSDAEFKHIRSLRLGLTVTGLTCAGWRAFSTTQLEKIAATRPNDQPFGWRNAGVEAKAELARRQREGDDSAAMLARRNAAVAAEKSRRAAIVEAELPKFLDNEAVYRTSTEGALNNATGRFMGFVPADFAAKYQSALHARWGGHDPAAPDWGMDGHD